VGVSPDWCEVDSTEERNSPWFALELVSEDSLMAREMRTKGGVSGAFARRQ